MSIVIAVLILVFQVIAVFSLGLLAFDNNIPENLKPLGGQIIWGFVYLSPLVGSLVIYLRRRKLRDAITFLLAMLFLDGIGVLLFYLSLDPLVIYRLISQR